MKKLMIIAVMLALATGCATRGTRFEMSDVEALQPGVSTYDEAVQRLGKPRAVNLAADGSKSVTWVYVQTGLATRTESRGTRILFDKDGKMIRIASKVE